MELTTTLTKHWVRSAGAGCIAAALVACAHSATSQNLVDARRAYDEAAASDARTRAPGELAEARAALDRAERAHDQDPGSAREVELADRAERKAHYAESRGEVAYERTADGKVVYVDRRPAGDRRVVASAPPPPPAERAPARPHARTERHADAALQSLAQVANVKEEPRGVVITLSGSLLFPNGDRDVSPIANQSLDQVAHALAAQPRDTTFQIEGYTDSTGSDEQNQELSARRAQAVADKLQQQGIDPSRISVVGRGEAAPIADNATPEGRASNRRVEIVVDRHGKG